jgi:hypothetical protein
VDAHSLPLERFIPNPEVRERFETIVRAPPDLVIEVAVHFDLQSLKPVKAIFWLREKLMGASPPGPRKPQGILEETKSLGWGLLTLHQGRLVVCGATCQPWLSNVKFSAVPPDAFTAFAEPDQVKIAWSLEAEEIGTAVTRFAQETRAVATDERARRKFRRYWRWARFGIVAIRLLMMPAVRREAERRWAVRRGGPDRNPRS